MTRKLVQNNWTDIYKNTYILLWFTIGVFVYKSTILSEILQLQEKLIEINSLTNPKLIGSFSKFIPLC